MSRLPEERLKSPSEPTLSKTFLTDLVNLNIVGAPIKVNNIHFEFGQPGAGPPLFGDNDPERFLDQLDNVIDIDHSMFITKIFDVDTADKDRLVTVLKGLNTQLSSVRVSIERFDRSGTSCIRIEQIQSSFNQFIEMNVHELSTAGKDPKEWLWSGWTQIEAHAFPGRILAFEGGSVPTRKWERVYGPDRERGP